MAVGADHTAPLTAAGIGKRYGPVRALDDVDLALAAGEIVALAGENGSGKSTLAGILAGVTTPDTGRLTVDGAPVRFAAPRDAMRSGIALVTQELTGVPSMTVAENVLLPAFVRPGQLVRRRRLVEQARPHLARVGLDVDPTAPLLALRPGQQELVELAKALAGDPRVLILDEVTTRLPHPEHLFAVLDRLAGEGMAVLFITHRLREIRRLAHRAVVLRDGRRSADLTAAQLTDECLSAAMVGRPLRDLYAKPAVPVGAPVLRVTGLVTDRTATPVDLTVRAGEVVGLAGLVGAGRSELLEAISGVRRRREGTVAVDGASIPPGSPAAAVRAGVGFVPEDRRTQGLHLSASVADNVAMVWLQAWSRTHRRRWADRARRAVDRFAIRCRNVDTPVGDLSGGNQQKVMLARALERQPRVLLLDEPTRGVDIGAKHDIYRCIGDLVADGTAVVIASSDLPELIGLCDRVLVLHEGVVTGEVDRAHATEERIAALAAGGTAA